MLGGDPGLGVEETQLVKIERRGLEQGRILGHIPLKSSGGQKQKSAPNQRSDPPRQGSPVNEAASERDPEQLKDPLPGQGKCEQNPVLSLKRNRQNPGLLR